MSYAIAELGRRVANLIRFGTVSAADYDNARVRVAMGEAESDWLPWLTQRAGNDRSWWAPEVGEQVLVLAASGELAQGVVLGSLFQNAHNATAADPSIDRRVYADGAIIEYDRESHTLKATVPGSLEAEVAQNVSVWAGGNVLVESQGKVRIEAPLIELAGEIALLGPVSAGGASGQALPVVINGSVVHRGGNFMSENDVIASGVSLKDHPHENEPTLPVATGGEVDDGDLKGWSAETADATESRAQNGYVSLCTAKGMAFKGSSLATEKDKLLLCIPEIADAMSAKKAGSPDAQGWLYLATFLRKWFNGMPSNDKAARIGSFVDWDWLLQYSNVEAKLNEISSNTYLSTPNAKALLAQRLKDLEPDVWASGGTFDHTVLPVDQAHSYHYQSVSESVMWLHLLGLTATIGRYTLYAVAKGTVSVSGDVRTITITGASVFLRDNFDFEDDYSLGNWGCENRNFSMALGTHVENLDFRSFRDRHTVGGDFYIYTSMRSVDGFGEVIYDAS